jgi:hypothetical protein
MARLPRPALDLSQDTGRHPPRELIGIQAKVERDQAGLALGEPVQQPHDLTQRCGHAAQSANEESLGGSPVDPTQGLAQANPVIRTGPMNRVQDV